MFLEKFFFFDLDLGDVFECFEEGLVEVFFYFNELVMELELYVDVSIFMFGCIFIVNFFKYKVELIWLNYFSFEYWVIFDFWCLKLFEVYFVDNVVVVFCENKCVEFCLFYLFSYVGGCLWFCYYWYVKWEWSLGKDDVMDGGMEVFLFFCDFDFNFVELG